MDRNKEIREALAAADDALDRLSRAGEFLGSARNWGILDILGGGIFTTLIKRSKMEDAAREMEQARAALERFRTELDDVDRFLDIRFNERDLMSFADYFFDGGLVDLLVQSRINDARASVDRTVAELQAVKRQLQNSLPES